MMINLPTDIMLELAQKHNGRLINGEIRFATDKDWNAFVYEAAQWHAFYNRPRFVGEHVN